MMQLLFLWNSVVSLTFYKKNRFAKRYCFTGMVDSRPTLHCKSSISKRMREYWAIKGRCKYPELKRVWLYCPERLCATATNPEQFPRSNPFISQLLGGTRIFNRNETVSLFLWCKYTRLHRVDVKRNFCNKHNGFCYPIKILNFLGESSVFVAENAFVSMEK